MGTTGVGSGLFMTPMLTAGFGSPPAVAAGTDIAHTGPLATVAGLVHLRPGAVDFSFLTGLLVGSIPGIALGAVIGKRLPSGRNSARGVIFVDAPDVSSPAC